MAVSSRNTNDLGHPAEHDRRSGPTQQIPAVAGQVEEDRDAAVGFGARGCQEPDAASVIRW